MIREANAVIIPGGTGIINSGGTPTVIPNRAPEEFLKELAE